MQREAELEIEMQIWEYLDRLCSAEDEQRISMLIASDPSWKAKHEEIVAMHAAIGNNLEQEQPGMRFTQNVMDAVFKEAIAPAAKTYLNKWVIRGIAAFFVVILGVFIINAFGTVDATDAGSNYLPSLNLDWFTAPSIPFNTLFYGFIFLNIIAGLILVDSLLKKKRREMHNA
jgi:hypothetical protein